MDKDRPALFAKRELAYADIRDAKNLTAYIFAITELRAYSQQWDIRIPSKERTASACRRALTARLHGTISKSVNCCGPHEGPSHVQNVGRGRTA